MILIVYIGFKQKKLEYVRLINNCLLKKTNDKLFSLYFNQTNNNTNKIVCIKYSLLLEKFRITVIIK